MIVVDSRERQLIELVKDEAVVEVQTLSVADVLITDASGKVHLAVERKTVDDLKASLMDGRFQEQRARMQDAYGTVACYLIEGQLEHSDRKTDGAVIGLIFRHGIRVVRSIGLRDTVAFLLNAHDLVSKDRLSPAGAIVRAPCSIQKAKATTAEELTVSMLRSVPGVSHSMASVIYKECGSIGDIARLVSVQPSVLCDLKVSNRKLGKVGQRIAEVLAAKEC